MGNEALERLLSLAATLLDTSVPIPFAEIKRRMPSHYLQSDPNTARRQFERDKESLLDIGINVEMVRGQTDDGTEGYRATRARELQKIDLTPDELAALHLAATRVALEGVDEAEVVTGIQKLGGVVGAGGSTMAKIEMPEALGDLFEAVLHRKVAAFTYNQVDRELEPHRIGFERGRWYVAGYDRTRGASRNFRVDRVEGKVTLGDAGGFAAPDRRDEIHSEAWTLGTGEAVEVTILLDREVAPVFLHDYPSVVPGGADDAGACPVTLAVTHQAGLFNVLVPFLERAEILGPPDVRAAFVEHLQTMAEGE